MIKYVLDTNIFSELAKPNPNHKVAMSFAIHGLDVYLASTVWQELLYGVALMADGKKKKDISDFFHIEVANFPMLSYDKQSATIHAQIRAECRKKGKTLAFADSQIASIAMANNAVLVTRNLSDFEGVDGLKIENWFE